MSRKFIREKIRILTQLGIICTRDMEKKMAACQNDIQLDNCVRQFIINSMEG